MIVVFMLPLLAVGAYFGVVGALDELWSYTVVLALRGDSGQLLQALPADRPGAALLHPRARNYTPFQPWHRP